MKNLSDAQISMLRYYWENKGDIERYSEFKELIPQIQEQYPELLKAWYDYKASGKIMDAVVKSL